MYNIDRELKDLQLEQSPVSEATREKVLRMASEQARKKRLSVQKYGRRKRFALCGAAVLLAATVLLSVLPARQISYYTIDINPSISIAADKNDTVLSVTAENEDAQVLLSGMALTNISFQEALRAIVQAAVRQGYLQQDGHLLVAHFGDSAGLDTAQIEAVARQAADAPVRVLVLESTKTQYENARKQRERAGIVLLEETAAKMGLDDKDVDSMIDSLRAQNAKPQNAGNAHRSQNADNAQENGNGEKPSPAQNDDASAPDEDKGKSEEARENAEAKRSEAKEKQDEAKDNAEKARDNAQKNKPDKSSEKGRK